MTKPKVKGISPNKIGEKEHRRAESIQQKLQQQGMGRDEAWHRAIEMAVEEIHGGEGGGGGAGGGSKHSAGSEVSASDEDANK
jgi:hypothetical protein